MSWRRDGETINAYVSWEVGRDKWGDRIRRLPAEPGPRHAVDIGYRLTEDVKCITNPLTARCGALVQVLVDGDFQADADDACEACAQHVAEGTWVRRDARAEVPTARVHEDDESGKTVYWVVCHACQHVGRDQASYALAAMDATRHNREYHHGRTVVG